MSQRSSKDQCLSTLSQIFPFLYVGSQEDALSIEIIQKNQITHVINVSTTGDRPSFLNEDDNEHFLRIPINDSLDAQLLPYFDQAYAFIEKARSNKGHVLIHCLAGISRSPALAIAYVIRYLHLSADDAYKHVKERRRQISPNFNFLGQLRQYESNLTSISTNNSIPKCIKVESPVNERRYCIQVESCSHIDNSIKHRTNVLKRPTCFNFDSMNARRSQTITPSLSCFAQLTLQSIPQQQQQQFSFQPSESSQSNDVSMLDDEFPGVKLINSSYDEIRSKKRIEVTPKTPLLEQSDLINSYFQGSEMLSKSLEQWKSSQTFDTNTETITNGVLTSSLEVFVL
ncbi:hypothetical protein I4U23_021013 [Adineta vaga]|nr:hypothetical protein I4U23_021013 [Adineta vaga]